MNGDRFYDNIIFIFRAAITKYYRLAGLTTELYFLTVLKARSPRSRFSLRSLLLGYLLTMSSRGLSSLHMHPWVSVVSTFPLLYKDIS